jgi:hypothetical protein
MQRDDTASTVILWLARLFMLGFVVQLFLASLGMMGAESYEAHKSVGFTAMHLISLLVLIAAVAGPNRKRDWPLGLGFFVLVTITIFLAGARDDHPWIAAFHPLFALGSTAFAGFIAMRVRGGRPPAHASQPAA